MNRKQWFASAVIFLVFAILVGSSSSLYGGLWLASPIDSEYTLLDASAFMAARIYGGFTWLFFSFSFVCLACGFLEKGDKKKVK